MRSILSALLLVFILVLPVSAAPELPRPGTVTMIDLGAKSCIPCKRMAPILEKLEAEYRGKADVVFIDVWEKPDAGGPYGIKIIPTQIFFDAEGKELFRHEGFFSKENILGKWRELGVKLDNNAVVRSQHPE